MKKIIFIIAGLALLIIIVAFIYFVSGITSGNSVIKKYVYSGGVKEFIYHVQKFSLKDSNVVSKITDTTGNAHIGYTFYMEIKLKYKNHDILYSIACESDNNKGSKTAVELVMALDTINNLGGYNKKAKGINPLVKNFDVNFLAPLSNSENIKITPL